MGMAYGDYYGANAVNKQQPSPYATMGASSAGNPASSYGSSGGASAGAWGTQAPTYQAPQSIASTRQSQGQAVQGYRAPTGYPTYSQPQQSTYNYPQQQQGGAQAPPSFKLPGGGTDQQAMTNWYNSQQAAPPPTASGGSSNGGIWNPGAPKWNPQTQQWEYPQGGYQQQGQPQGIPQPPPTQAGGVGSPPPNHDTNGYQSPKIVQAPASRYAMPGWDNAKWNDPNNQDPKYVVGRILSNLPGRTDQMGTAVQAIKAAYPGTQQVGAGDISIPGVGVIDILMKSSTGGSGWWWGAGQAGGGAVAAKPAGQAVGAQDPYAMLMQALMSPTPPAGYQQAARPAAAPVAQQFDITKDPQYQKMAAQLAQLQQQATTWQTEQAAASRGNSGNNPSFSYY